MGYFNPDLLQQERVAYRDHQHWIIFLSTIVWAAVTVVFYMWTDQMLIIWGLLICTLISLVYNYISYMSSLFMITNRRVIMRTGFFQRISLEIFLNKIEGIQVNQNLLGSVMSFGTVTVIGTGGTQDSFFKINHPLQFRTTIQREMHKQHNEGKH